MTSPSPQDVAREAREALSHSRETPDELYERLVRRGWINRRGEVTRILGGNVEPESTPESDGRQEANGNGRR
jgi:hypothetical protein